ncbi:MAG TPA: hypothetical protein VMR76_02235 [Candidatus Saccharimonadia bacterium]|nr:hypothetical protein [Candidatus Saccharimonadia bacterium]
MSHSSTVIRNKKQKVSSSQYLSSSAEPPDYISQNMGTGSPELFEDRYLMRRQLHQRAQRLRTSYKYL